MARFTVENADKFGGQGGGGYFSLKNDKDTARVRFLFDSIDDVEGYAVHEVELDGKKRYVNCLRDYGAPVDDCPFCAARKFVTAKYFIPLYNIDEERIQTWERGKKFGGKLTSMCSRYSHLVSHEFEIERNGKPKDTSTTYEIYEVGSDASVTMDDFDVPPTLGTIVLDKTADDMKYFLDYGDFPSDGAEEVRPRNSRNDRDADRGSYDRSSGRRTPSSGRQVF